MKHRFEEKHLEIMLNGFTVVRRFVELFNGADKSVEILPG